MASLSANAIREVDAFWAADSGCAAEDLDAVGIGVVEMRAADGSEFVRLLRRKRRVQVACSPSLGPRARELAGRHTAESIFDVGALARCFAVRAGDIIGPAYLGYLDAIEAPRDERIRMLSAEDGGALDELRRRITATEWEHAGLDAEQPIAASFADGALVSAAGYEVWRGRIAHIGVLTRADRRGVGLGRACVAAAASHAIERGLIAQYRTLFSNPGSTGVARALGFVPYGATIYLSIPPTDAT